MDKTYAFLRNRAPEGIIANARRSPAFYHCLRIPPSIFLLLIRKQINTHKFPWENAHYGMLGSYSVGFIA